jgi:hypothetical protein
MGRNSGNANVFLSQLAGIDAVIRSWGLIRPRKTAMNERKNKSKRAV